MHYEGLAPARIVHRDGGEPERAGVGGEAEG